MDYESIINRTGLTLVEFYATWCPHCRHMMPVVEQLKELLGEMVPVYQLDIDKYPEEASEAEAESVPTFIIYRNGRELWRRSGEMDGQELLNTIDSFVER